MQSINASSNFGSYGSASAQNKQQSEQAPQYQQGQFALNQNELNAIHALTAAGVVGTAFLNPNAIAELNTSTLWGPLSFLQGNSWWADEARVNTHAYNNIVPFRRWSDAQKHHVMHYAQNGNLGPTVIKHSVSKEGGVLTDIDGNRLDTWGNPNNPNWWSRFNWRKDHIQTSAASQRALENGAKGAANGVNTAGKQALFKTELHTPEYMYNLKARQVGNWNPLKGDWLNGRAGFNLFYDARDDLNVAQGSTGRVTQEALNHGKQLEKIDRFKVQQKADPTLERLAASNDYKNGQRAWDAYHKTQPNQNWTLDLKKDWAKKNLRPEQAKAWIDYEEALYKKKAARSAKIKQAQQTYQTLDAVRLEQASNDLIHKQRIVDLDTRLLDDLRAKPSTPQIQKQIADLEARLTKNQALLNDQKLHFDKLNRRNAQFLKTHTAQNLDDIAGSITKTKPNWWQKLWNGELFKKGNADKATEMLLQQNLKDLGLSKDQLKQVQNAMAQGAPAVKETLTKIMAENRSMADVVGDGIHKTTTSKPRVGFKNGPSTESLAKHTRDLLEAGGNTITQSADKALDATLQAKHASSVGRNALGIGAKFTKGLAIVGTVLEGLNFVNNMNNGNYRKAATDLTTSLVSGGVGLLAGAGLAAIGIAGFPALLAVAAVGMGVSMVGAPVIDNVIKTTGLTNQGERDAKKAEQDKAKLQRLLTQ